jgi:hypothetical protein
MIEAARLPDGSAPADDFLVMLEESKGELRRRLADIAVRFEDYAHRGTLRVPRELNDLGDGIREIKAGNVRLPFFEIENQEHSPVGVVRLTNGFVKKTWNTPRKHILKAVWVRGKDQES